MSIPSGGAPLGPQDPTSIDITDMQQNGAASQVQRQDIGMVKDTLSQPLTELANAKVDVKGSQPDRPSLAHPVTTVEIAPDAKSTANEAAIQEKYQQFLEKLPVELQMQLIQNAQLPVDQQDPKLFALSQTILGEAIMAVAAEMVNSAEIGAPGEGPKGAEGAAKGEIPGVILDADGKPIKGQTAINGDGEKGEGGEGASQEFWSKNNPFPGAAAREFVQANLPPGATQAQQAEFAAKFGIPGPMNFNIPVKDQTVLLMANGVQTMTSVQTTLEKTQAAIPLDDPNSVVLGEYLMIIKEAIDACKAALRLMMTTQTDIESKDARAKTDTMMSKLKATLEKLEATHDAGKGGGTGKLVGMIILAIAVAVLTVVTGGLACFLLACTAIGAVPALIIFLCICAVAILELVLAISSAASYNIVAEILKLLASFMNAIGIPSPTAEILIATVIIIIAALLVVVIVALLITGVGAALALVLVEIIVPLLITTIATTNCITVALVPLMTALGIPEDVARILAIVIMMVVIVLLVLVGAAGGFSAASSAARGAEAAANASVAASKTGAAASKTSSAGTKTASGGTKAASGGAKAGTGAANQADEVGDMAKGVEAVSEGTTEQVNRTSSVLNKFNKITRIRMIEGLNNLAMLGEIGVQTAQGGMAIGQAIIMFKRAQLAMEIGDLELLIATFEAYLKVLDTTMKQIQDSIEDLMQTLSGLSQLFSHIIQTMSQTVSSLERVS